MNINSRKKIGKDKRPVVLHLGHGWAGGIDRWIRCFCHHDEEHRHLVLKSGGFGYTHGLRLTLLEYKNSGQEETILGVWNVHPPIKDLDLNHDGYQRILGYIVEQYGIDRLIISSLIGHSLGALSLSLPTLVIIHDFFPFCPVLRVRFQGEICFECKKDRLNRCLASNPLQYQFAKGKSSRWLTLRHSWLEAVKQSNVKLIGPSQFAADHIEQLTGLRASVIPHGTDLEKIDLSSPYHEEEKIRCLVLGRLDMEKGESLFMNILPEASSFCEFFLLGHQNKSFSNKDLQIREVKSYANSELVPFLKSFRPHVALLLSCVPETFSFTLSELKQCCIPVIATDLGSFKSRIRNEENGFLTEATPESFLSQLRRVKDQPQLLEQVRINLREQIEPSPIEMVERYRDSWPLCQEQNLAVDGATHGPTSLPIDIRVPRLGLAIRLLWQVGLKLIRKWWMGKRTPFER